MERFQMNSLMTIVLWNNLLVQFNFAECRTEDTSLRTKCIWLAKRRKNWRSQAKFIPHVENSLQLLRITRNFLYITSANLVLINTNWHKILTLTIGCTSQQMPSTCVLEEVKPTRSFMVILVRLSIQEQKEISITTITKQIMVVLCGTASPTMTWSAATDTYG